MITAIPSSWKVHLEEELKKPYLNNLEEYLTSEYATQTVFPPQSQIFESLKLTPFDDVKVVILGQDPYHGAGQANGLAFSVNRSERIPPSLRNIYKELHSDLGITPPEHGDLSHWAAQGVLLLNSILTVRESTPGAHRKKGWETFTDAIVRLLNARRQGLVFLLWGNYAKEKGLEIDRSAHYALESAHPSPLSARNFLGNKHFSKTNHYLTQQGLAPINWQLPA